MIRSVGHMPVVQRKYACEGIEGLVDIYLQWLRNASEEERRDCALSSRSLRKYCGKYTSVQIFSLLLHPIAHETRFDIGSFISGMINNSGERCITYDMDAPFQSICERFENVLVNRGVANNYFGSYSRGVLINQNKGGTHFGFNSRGVVINLGHCDRWFGGAATGVVINAGYGGYGVATQASSIIINLGGVGEGFGEMAKGRVILPQGGFAEYIDELLDYAANKPEHIMEDLGTPEQIKKKIFEFSNSSNS